MENTKKTQDLLTNAIFEVFEKMFFVFLEPLDEDVNYDMVTSIRFSGPINGDIKVYFSQGVAELMVQNMLSIDPDDVTDKLIEDCTKEAINMISGNYLRQYDTSKVFDLSIPAFEKLSGLFSPQKEKSSDKELNLSFASDESFLGVKMTVN